MTSSDVGSVLVTGAAGYTGRALLEFLREHAAGVETLTTDLVESWRSPGEGSGHLRADLTRPGILDELIARRRPAAIFHLAAVLPPETGDRLWEVNVGATTNLLESVRRVRDYRPRILAIGSAAEYGASAEPISEEAPKNPVGAYALSKLAQTSVALAYAAEHGMDVVVARTFNLLGPGLSNRLVAGAFAHQIAERVRTGDTRPIEVGDLDTARDFLDVRDVVAAYWTLVREGRSRTAYNVCSGRAVTVRTLLEHMLERAGVPIAVRQIPERMRPGGPSISVGSSARLRTETSWKPTIALERSIADTLESYLGTP